MLRAETRDEYLSYDPAGKGTKWKSFWFHVGNFESPLPERVAGAPQVQASWSSIGPGGKQVECILGAIAKFKDKGVTGDSEADRVVVSESLYENPGSDPSLALEDIGS